MSLLAIASALWLGALVNGAAPAPAAGDDARFPTPRGMEGNVRFWLRVYTEWPTNRYAIHDDEQLDIVYRVVAANSGREARVKQAKAEVEAALARLDKTRPTTDQGLTGADLEVFRALAGSTDAGRFARARGHVRHQKGQRDRMAEALRESGRYREQIDGVFDEFGLPRELMAIAFVESMFNLGARSWSGALGIWQFLKGTGREYMNLNAVVDERRDPIVSTYAAANYLRSTYKRLGAWPVAITSYNYGNNGMARAVQACGTTDLPTIFRCYRKGGMGFAAQNYYTEFLAALQVMRQPAKFFPEVTARPRWRYDVIRLPATVSASELVQAQAIDASELAAFNPALTREALAGQVKLPYGMALRVPPGRGPAAIAAFANISGLKPGNVAAGKTHLVGRGDTIFGLAQRYGISPGELVAANHLPPYHKLVPGVQLAIPAKHAGTTLLPEARALAIPTLPGYTGPAIAVRPKPTAVEPVVARAPREDKPPLPSVHSLRIPGGRAILVAGPPIAIPDLAGRELAAELAVDVVTGSPPLPEIDVVTGRVAPPLPELVERNAGEV